MNLDWLNSVIARGFFGAAFVLLLVAVAEGIARFNGYTILRGTYSAGRMMELAALLLVFVIAIVLRQVREELRRKRS